MRGALNLAKDYTFLWRFDGSCSGARIELPKNNKNLEATNYTWAPSSSFLDGWLAESSFIIALVY